VFRKVALGVTALAAAAFGAQVASTASCAATPTNNPLRSFQDARNIDVVCMQTLATEDGGGIPPVPLPQTACTPVPTGVSGSELPNHLFALVTQVKRGEVAVADLTAGMLVNENVGLPGVNFLTVGQIPTGIASAPDGKMSYVACAEVNKPAIYGLPSTQILGNSQQLEGGRSPQPPLLTTWPVCALPGAPGPITIIPAPPPEPSLDAGASGRTDAGTKDGGSSDAGDVRDGATKDDAPVGPKSGDAGGTDAGGSPEAYVLAVVLPGVEEGVPARLVTIDPRPLLRGGGVEDAGAGPVDRPAQLTPCTIIGQTVFSGAVADAGAGAPWPDGVKWLEAGVDAPTPISATCAPGGGPDSGASLPSLPKPSPQPTAAARAGQYLYVADGALPLIHVFDLTVATHPVEIEPLYATSLASPSRSITVSTLAISPPTRDYRRYLYAVDSSDSPASIIVYDVTDPVHSPHVPMRRPHSALVPLQPEDRIIFSAGVSSLAFVEHDWPLAQTPAGTLVAGAAQTGLLCNPNPNVDNFALDAAADAQTFTDPGANYRYSSLAFADEPLGPTRLRGIFAFATLTSGQVMTIDVDDWDAPCRRPQYMGPQDAGDDGAVTSGYTSAIAPPQPNIGSRDGGPLDPYEAPFTGVTNGVTWVTNEVFFPVSEPNRPRSNFPLSDNPTLGLHYPYVTSAPQLYSAGPDGGIGAAINGSIAAGNPTLLPTATTLPDPAMLPDGGLGVRVAYEDPLAHIDQSWTIDYEGKLATFGSILGNVVALGQDYTEGLASERPPFYALFISDPGGAICSKGVEDWTVGQERAAAFLKANAAAGLADQPTMPSWLGDYVQVADEILPQTDPYWTLDPDANQNDDCWADFNGNNANGTPTPPLTDPTDRYNTCLNIFGYEAQALITRDFPIIQAFDDGLVITRFNYPLSTTAAPVQPSTSNRQITPPDISNVPVLKQLACCFHDQVTFNVRAGGEWVTTGSASGYLHHITRDPSTNRCVTSCDPQQALLNARAIGIAPALSNATDAGTSFSPDRDSPLAMRNPMFAFFVQHPFGPDPNISPEAVLDGGIPTVVSRPPRDDVWEFAMKGELTPLAINLTATNTNVDPQSMLFIPSLGQLAVVDGSQSGQGLILIDLNAVAITGNTYY
jgi:hypothetical protein